MTNGVAEIIRQGQNEGDIKKEIEPITYAKRIYSMIQGSIFLAIMTKSNESMRAMMDHIDQMIESEMKI